MMKKRVYGFLLVGLIFVMLVLPMVLAQEVSSGDTKKAEIAKKINNAFSLTGKEMFVKFLFIILLSLLVYAAVDFLPLMPKNEFVKGLFAVIVAILGFVFVPKETIYQLVTGFEALGIALVTFIPLIIIIALLYKMSTTHPAIAKFISKPIFILFGLYLLTRLLINFFLAPAVPGREGIGGVFVDALDYHYTWIYLLTLILTFVWVTMGDLIMNKFGATQLMTDIKTDVRAMKLGNAEKLQEKLRHLDEKILELSSSNVPKERVEEVKKERKNVQEMIDEINTIWNG